MFPHGSYRRFLSARVALFLLPLLVYVSVLERSAAGLTRTNLKLNGFLVLFKHCLGIIDLHNLLIGDTIFERTPR